MHMLESNNLRCAIQQLVFTKEQVTEQQQFEEQLKNGTADIVFEGSVLEAKAYLNGLKELVDTHLH